MSDPEMNLGRSELDSQQLESVEELREFIQQSHAMLSAAQTSLALRIALNSGRHPTTRSNYLMTLDDRIGPKPERRWEAEWDTLMSSAWRDKVSLTSRNLLSWISRDGNGAASSSQWRSSGKLVALIRDPSFAQELTTSESPVTSARNSMRSSVEGSSTPRSER